MLKWMIRTAGLLVAVASLSSTVASARQHPKETTFPSGRKVTIVDVQQIEFKDDTGMEWALLLEYETRLKITDRVGLKKEVDEIWRWFKVDVEHRKLKVGLIDIKESPGVSPVPNDKRAGSIFRKQSDGSWKRS